MTWTPHLTVAAIIEQNQRFLLVEEQSEGLIVFNQPAGHWEKNETLIEAVIRETLEETAYHFRPQSLTGIYTHTSSNNHITYVRLCFSGQLLNHEPQRQLDEGILRAVWMTRDEIAQNDRLRSPMVLRCVDDYLAGQRFSLESLIHL